jgi:hypothetical protein
MKRQQVRLKDIKAGVTIYTVHALGTRSYLQQQVITSRPYVNNYGSLFYRYGNNESSCKDMNMIPNQYNYHKAFFTENAAKRYVETCAIYDIDSTIEDDEYYDSYKY